MSSTGRASNRDRFGRSPSTNQAKTATKSTCRLPSTVASPAPTAEIEWLHSTRSPARNAPASRARHRSRPGSGGAPRRRDAATRAARTGRANVQRNSAATLADEPARRISTAELAIHDAPANAAASGRLSESATPPPLSRVMTNLSARHVIQRSCWPLATRHGALDQHITAGRAQHDTHQKYGSRGQPGDNSVFGAIETAAGNTERGNADRERQGVATLPNSNSGVEKGERENREWDDDHQMPHGSALAGFPAYPTVHTLRCAQRRVCTGRWEIRPSPGTSSWTGHGHRSRSRNRPRRSADTTDCSADRLSRLPRRRGRAAAPSHA